MHGRLSPIRHDASTLLAGIPQGFLAVRYHSLSVNGTADLSVVIRTLVASPHGLTIGAGGAIVAASEPEAELEEIAAQGPPAAGGGRRHARSGPSASRSPSGS